MPRLGLAPWPVGHPAMLATGLGGRNTVAARASRYCGSAAILDRRRPGPGTGAAARREVYE